MAYLHKRGYSRHFLRQEITRTKNITRNEALLPKSATTITTDKSECVPFTLTYNAALRSISSIIRKHISILTSSHRCHNIFKSAPIVAFLRSNNLTNFLVRAKLRKPLQNNTPPRGSFQCGNHCSTCTYIIQRTCFLHIPLHRRSKTHYSPHLLQLKKPYLHYLVQTPS